MRQLQKKIKNGTLNIKQDDPFELFVAATNIRYCYYNETHKILGNTFGMCVLQVGAFPQAAATQHCGGFVCLASPRTGGQLLRPLSVGRLATSRRSLTHPT